MTAGVGAQPLADISARIAAIQAKIATVAPRGVTGSAGAFAAALASVAPTAATAATAAGGSAVTGTQIVAEAKTYLGVPYVWGGESRSGIDCSGLVQATFAKFGVQLPRVAADQAQMGTEVPSLADARPGDLVTFGNPAYHIAIYLGNNQIIEAPEPGKSVRITELYQTPTSIRRIADVSDTAAVGAAGQTPAQLVAAGRSPAVAAFADRFAAAEAQFHLPSGLLAAVAQQESGGNARAVSPAGAQGLMQLMPATAAGLGVNAFDPAQAIPAAAKILSQNLTQFGGSLSLALAAYNAGAGAVARYGGVPPYPETQNYVRSITAMLGVPA